MQAILNEKQWRQFLALEALELKNIQKVAQDAGVSKHTVRLGLKEMEEGDLFTPGARQRKKGAGRKKKESQEENLLADLEGLLDPKGDPMSLVRWTRPEYDPLEAGMTKTGTSGGREYDPKSTPNTGLFLAVEQEN